MLRVPEAEEQVSRQLSLDQSKIWQTYEISSSGAP